MVKLLIVQFGKGSLCQCSNLLGSLAVLVLLRQWGLLAGSLPWPSWSHPIAPAYLKGLLAKSPSFLLELVHLSSVTEYYAYLGRLSHATTGQGHETFLLLVTVLSCCRPRRCHFRKIKTRNIINTLVSWDLSVQVFQTSLSMQCRQSCFHSSVGQNVRRQYSMLHCCCYSAILQYSVQIGLQRF